jgi:zinc protease
MPPRPDAATPATGLLRAALSALLLAVLLHLAPSPTAALQEGASVQNGPELFASIEGISEYRLPNGLRVVLFPDASRPSTTVNITYFVGSRHESYGESGMAHLLEHLLFKGTPTHPNVPQELTERGGRANGTTWYDRTNYFITFPASDDNLEWAIRLEADRMVNSFVRQEDLDSEMTVVRNEWEMGENSPFRVLMDRVTAAAYRWHGYGRTTIGARADIENVPIERLQAFYRRYYQPDNAILVISGTFDEDRTLAWVDDYFSPIPAPDRSGELRLWDTYTREPAQDGERVVTVRRVGDVQMIMLGYHIPAAAHDDFTPVDLLGHILTNAPSGRLYRSLVEPGLASSVTSNAFALREPGLLMVMAEVPSDGDLGAARAEMYRVLDDLTENPPTEEEVERARAARLRTMQQTMSNSEWVGLDLTEYAASGDWRLLFLRRDRIESTTPDDVARAARSYLLPSNRTTGLFIPEPQPFRAQIPDAPDIASLLDGYEGRETVALGEAFEPTHDNIESRTTRFDLDNGFRVALMPKATRGGIVHVRFAQRIGNEDDLTGRSMAGSLAGGMLMRGTESRSRQELNDELARIQTQLSVTGSATIVTGSIQTTREHLPRALELLLEVLNEPAFDEGEFETLRRERITILENQRSEPNALGSIAFQRHMNPRPVGHPQYTETFDEAIATVRGTSLDDVRRFYDEFHGFGSGGNISALGDFDPTEMEAFVRAAFTGRERARPYVRVDNPFRPIEPGRIEIETPDKSNAFFQAGTVFQLRDDHEDYPALVLAGYMLGGGFLNSRLAERIRGQEGLSYGIGGNFSVPPIDDRAQFTAFAIYAPENAARLVEVFMEEIERALADGFTAEEVEAAKRGWMQQRDVARATDAQLIGTLQNGLFLGRDLFHDRDEEARVRALTPEQIHEALRRHLDPAALTIVRAGDFAAPVSEDRDDGDR